MHLNECNQCGRCCEAEGFRCEYLKGAIGQETRCGVYEARFDMMPIRLINSAGAVVNSYCYGPDNSAQTNRLVLLDCSVVRGVYA